MSQQEISNVTESTPAEECLHFTTDANSSSSQRMYKLLDELESEVHLMQHARTSMVIDLIIFLRQQISYLHLHSRHPFTADSQAAIDNNLQANRYWDYP